MGRNRKAEYLGGFKIDNERKLLRLLHRQIGWLGAFQNLVHVDGDTAEMLTVIRPKDIRPPASTMSGTPRLPAVDSLRRSLRFVDDKY